MGSIGLEVLGDVYFPMPLGEEELVFGIFHAMTDAAASAYGQLTNLWKG